MTWTRYSKIEREYVDVGPAVELSEQLDPMNRGAIFEPGSPFPVSLAAPENFGKDGEDPRAIPRMAYTCVHEKGSR
jgi:hypothetical protein